ncbi:MAG: hypothetical protein QOI10_473 [Solirubrobacterales bacterium]|jgi:hypothetical protein|nr:hypothetical protein [Solirubrobacterales bacterium]
MDRARATSNLTVGMILASIALAVFGLVFLITIIYIG